MSIFTKKAIKANDKDKNIKIKMVDVSELKFDKEFKAVFQQENDKVVDIANDMKVNGFDKTRPIVITKGLHHC